MTTSRKITLASRPTGTVGPENFTIVEEAVRGPAEGEVVVRNDYFSIDPYQRGRMGERKSYAKNMQVGDTIVAATAGEVVESASERFPVGTRVIGYLGWQEYGTVPSRGLQAIDTDGVPASAYLGILGLPGVTAWVGMTQIGKPKEGETVVVSAAAGAVGGVAAQWAKAQGSRVVGIAGGATKCRHLLDVLRLDAAVDYRDADFRARLAEAVPGGIDVYFDNVGGEVTDAVIDHLNNYARIPFCGTVSGYNGEDTSIANVSRLLAARARLEGFICSDRLDLWKQGVGELTTLYHAGGLTQRETVAEGFDSTIDAFIGLLKGANVGKQLVKLR